jgi:hypothetical protein
MSHSETSTELMESAPPSASGDSYRAHSVPVGCRASSPTESPAHTPSPSVAGHRPQPNRATKDVVAWSDSVPSGSEDGFRRVAATQRSPGPPRRSGSGLHPPYNRRSLLLEQTLIGTVIPPLVRQSGIDSHRGRCIAATTASLDDSSAQYGAASAALSQPSVARPHPD